jgi:hypothetical protein
MCPVKSVTHVPGCTQEIAYTVGHFSGFATSGAVLGPTEQCDWMPGEAWKWVAKWLRTRRAAMLPESDWQPWGAYAMSNGVGQQLSWAAVKTLHRARVPPWRLGALLRAEWRHWNRPIPFSAWARRFLPAESSLRQMAMG